MFGNDAAAVRRIVQTGLYKLDDTLSRTSTRQMIIIMDEQGIHGKKPRRQYIPYSARLHVA